ncbi:ADP-ribose pyrophosphatase YjhB (NUDIX family) [Streptosporangium album]|uniref:ADP-ribose pyrophosphatase YjhB (NUDIX family) n=2 Tax=Streptosporangium album TaxID=47479 RepID=A0A7W7S5N3_9ACTN|nr:ADP-ribose pyrophosphatase YjhB (NUDIX family) [Streptosporangium album]
MALSLAAALGRGHGIIVDVQPFLLKGEALISVWVGLVVRADGHRYRWVVPGSETPRGRPLWTCARRPARAAARLADQYEQLRTQPVVSTILRGPLLADDLLASATRGHHVDPQ